MYTLYGFPKTRSVRVAWALEEMGLEYSYQLVNLRKGDHLSESFRMLSPTAKIPLLQTEEGVISESAAIVTWLADKHGYQEFIPKLGTLERGKFEQMMLYLVTELEQPLWAQAKHTFALPEDKRVEKMLEVAAWEFSRALKVFSELLGDDEYLVGNQFTVADIVAGHLLAWAKGNGISFNDGKVASYAERVLGRDAYRRAWQNEKQHLDALSE